MPASHRWLVGTTVVATVATGALLWVSRPDPPPDDPVHAALCDSLAAIADDESPREPYVEGAHDGIHELIERLEDVDRAASEAYADINEAVETALDGHAPDPAARLSALVDATREVRRLLDEPDPGPCA